MFTTIRTAALAATTALTLFGVVAPAEAARNDWSGGEPAWLTEMHTAIDRDNHAAKQGDPGAIIIVQDRPADAENQDKAAKDASAKAASAASARAAKAARDAKDASTKLAKAAKDASTKAAKAAIAAAAAAAHAATAAAAAATAAATTAADAAIAAANNATAATASNGAVGRAVDAAITAANAAAKIATATDNATAIAAAKAAAAATALIKISVDAADMAAPHVYKCAGHAGEEAIETGKRWLTGTNKGCDSESGKSLFVQVIEDVGQSVQHIMIDPETSGDPAKHVCKTIGKLGTTFAIYGTKIVIIAHTGPLGLPVLLL